MKFTLNWLQDYVYTTSLSPEQLAAQLTMLGLEVDSVILAKKAEEFGITKFKYAGSLIKDSRKWCVDHVGKIYTLEEIENWESQKWQGKKSGDSFVVRGGWNCRHRWLPVVD